MESVVQNLPSSPGVKYLKRIPIWVYFFVYNFTSFLYFNGEQENSASAFREVG
jgi:hypothetical protein